MGFISDLLGGPVEAKAVSFERLLDLFGNPSKTGVAVTVDAALQCTTALACTMAIASGLAMLPLKLYRGLEKGGRREATDEPLYYLIDAEPNEWQTPVEWVETKVMHAVLAGGGYSYINRKSNGEVGELIPLLPANVCPHQAPDYRLTYKISLADGRYEEVDRRNILHLRSPSWNGYSGLDATRLAREAIGLALATEETHARLHSNGARPGGILTTDGKLDDAGIGRVRAQWEQVQGGLANAWKTAILQGGLKWQSLAMSGVDSQHIETRKFQIEEICRAFGVFPQMVGHSDKTATYASAEQFFLAHVVHTLSRWTRRFEKRLDVDLLTPKQRQAGLYFKFSFQALLRGDNKTRAEFYRALIMLGVMTRNEARLLEEMNPIDGLDEPLIPLNMATQEERDAAASEIADTVKSLISAGGSLDGLEQKIGRVLSSKNERRIVNARDELTAVLSTLPPPEGTAE